MFTPSSTINAAHLVDAVFGYGTNLVKIDFVSVFPVAVFRLIFLVVTAGHAQREHGQQDAEDKGNVIPLHFQSTQNDV